MCGRFTLHTPAHRLAEVFGVRALANLAPRYNIAPTQDAAVVRRADDGERRALVLLRWGLIPHWARDPAIGNRLINARAETVADKPSFRDAFAGRRCLVAADGFYEWQKTTGGDKRPWYIHLENGAPFAIAGLWERWWDPRGDTVESCTLITTEASEALRPIHHRMPVILPPGDHEAWLDPAPPSREALMALLRPYAGDDLIAHPVGRMVNDTRNDGPECIAAAGHVRPR